MVPTRRGPRGRRVRRLFRGIFSLVGRLLMVVALLAASIVALWVAIDLLSEEPITRTNQAVIQAAAAAGCLTALWIGVKLARGRRNLVLFLRKFGFPDAIGAVNGAVASAMKRRWRLVTLDDSEVEAVGVPSGRHAVAALLAAGGIGLIVLGFFEGWFIGLIEDPEGEDFLFEDAAAAVIAAYFIPLLVLVAIRETFRFLVARAVNRDKGMTLSVAAQVDPAAQRVRKLSRRVVAPPLVVVTVAEHIWQAAVRNFAAISNSVLIDISEPTENLLWEIETLRPSLRGRWVLICDDRHFRRPRTTKRWSDLHGRLDVLLAGEEVLLYSAASRRHLRRFSRALRRRLESVPR